jgi:HEXXH motif-containing protein
MAAGHPHARAVDHAYDVLAEIERKQPEAVRGTLGYPAVGAWAARTVQALAQQRSGSPAEPYPVEPYPAEPSPARPDPAQLGAIASVAALKAGVACRVEVPATDGVITLPSLGQIVCPGGGELVDLVVHADGRVEAGGVRVRSGPGEQPGWRPLRRVGSADGSLSLLVDDLDPFRWIGRTVIGGRLSEDELRTWRTCLDEAWRMLRKQHWTIADETRAIVSVLTPIQAPPQGVNSASDGGRFGTVALSTPPDGRWLASTFAHEVQHAKLGAILDVVQLLEPDDGRYYAPWRPDPRPLSGLIQGVYAYLGVSGFWRRQRALESDLRPHVEFAHWRESAHSVTGTLLDSGRLTATGEAFVTAARRTLAAWLDEPVPAAALEVARREADEHRQDWLARNSPTG